MLAVELDEVELVHATFQSALHTTILLGVQEH